MAKYSVNNITEIYELLEDRNINFSNKYSYAKNGKTYMMSLGRIFFNCLLPEDYPVINETIDKKLLYNTINDIYKKYGSEETSEFMTRLNKEVWKISTIHPVSFSINDTILPEKIKERKEKELTIDTPPEEFSNKLTNISEEYIKDLPDDSGIKDIIQSGGRGDPVDYGVLQIAKGPVMSIESEVTDPILSSLSDGYNPKEYYDAASGARRGYFIRSRGTAEPGTLARGAIYANSNTKIGKDDCKTKKYFVLNVTDKIAKVINGRYYMDDKTNSLKLIEDGSKLIGKTIKLRSPLYCKDKTGICKTCYGKLYDNLETRYIGLIAGQVINDAGQSFTMSQRHKSTAINIKEVDFTKDIKTF